LDGSRGTGRGRPPDAAVLLGLLVAADLVAGRLLVVHGRGRGGRAKVHVVQVVEVGRPGAVWLVTVGRGRLDDGPATDHGAGARESGRGRARRHGEVAAGRGADRRTVAADGRRVVTGDTTSIRICAGQETKK